MAQYSDFIAGLSVGSYGNGNGTISGFTQLWAPTSTARTYTVNADVDSPSGKSLRCEIGGTSTRTLLGIDSLSADANRGTCEVIVKCRTNVAPTGSAAAGHGIAFNGSGAATTETAQALTLGRNGTSHCLRRQPYSAGAAGSATNATGSLNSITGGTSPIAFWMQFLVTPTAWTMRAYAGNDLDGTIVSSATGSHSLADGVIGLFNFLNSTYMDFLYVSAGTGGDAAPRPSASTPISFSGTIPNQTFTNGDSVNANLSTYFSGTLTPFSFANIGSSLASIGLSINSSGFIVGTAVTGSVSSVVIRGTDTGANTADSNAFNVTVNAASTTMQLDTVSDLVNASAVNSTITGATTATPTAFITPRAATVTFSPAGFWRNLVAKFTGCAGKQPIFRFDRATQELNTALFSTSWRLYWTADFVTFTAFPAPDVSSGTSGYYQVQHTTTFSDDVIYVMTNPMRTVASKQSYVAGLIAANPSVISPTQSAIDYKTANPSAPDNSCFVQPSILYPAESGEPMSGQQVGQTPVLSFQMKFGGSTTDGGPKRKAILGQGQHAQGEEQAFMSLMGFIDYVINDPAAASLRSNFDFYCYININGSGIKGGNKRLGFESVNDYNREWLKVSPLATVAAVRSAMQSDCGGSADVLIDWHGTADNRGDYNNIHSSFYQTANNTTWNGLVSSYFNMANADVSTVDETQGYIINWAYTALGAKYATHAEHANRGNNSPANFAAVGKAWAQTLQAADAGGMFYTVPTGSLFFNGVLPKLSAAAVIDVTRLVSVAGEMPRLTASIIANLPTEQIATFSGTMPRLSMSIGVVAVVPQARLNPLKVKQDLVNERRARENRNNEYVPQVNPVPDWYVPGQ